MMGPEQMQPQFTAVEKSKMYKMILLGFAVVHLILAVMMMFVKGNIGGGQGGV